MDRVRASLIIIVLLAGVVAFLSVHDSRESEVVHLELAFGFALRVVGGLVSVVGLMGMFGQWYAGAGAARLVAGGVVVLAGVAVASQSWGPALGLAAVLAAALAFPRGPTAAAEPGRGSTDGES